MTVDGGVLLYGVGGHDPTRPDALLPFDLAGSAERIDQVAQTGIDEPPSIGTRDITSDRHPGRGYLAVVIPASPRAPHMLTIGGDNRYWGRGATGNRLLSEGEVARLYARREQWEVDRGSFLARVIAENPFEFEEPADNVGPIVVIARPVAGSAELLRRAAARSHIDLFLQREISQRAATADPYPGQGTSGLETVGLVSRRGAQVWVLGNGREPTSIYQARVEASADGTLVYWHSPTINSAATQGGAPVLMEQSVTRAVDQLLAVAAWLYAQAGYLGAVDIAAGLLHIESARAASLARAFEPGPQFGAESYRRHARVTTLDIQQDRRGTVRRVLAPLYEAISARGYDPYGLARAT